MQGQLRIAYLTGKWTVLSAKEWREEEEQAREKCMDLDTPFIAIPPSSCSTRFLTKLD